VDTVYMVVAGAVAFGGSLWIGYRYGVRCRRLVDSRYWIANAVGLLVGCVVAAVGSMLQLTWLWVAAIAVMAGSLSGLKYGLGRYVGSAAARQPGSRARG
jgi:hypothetical protein